MTANMVLADKTEESEEDMTAAETAPRPKNATALGVKKRSTSGRTKAYCSGGISTVVTLVVELKDSIPDEYSVIDQSEKCQMSSGIQNLLNWCSQDF